MFLLRGLKKALCESVLKCGKCKVRGGAFLFPWHSNFSRAIKKVWGLENARTKKNPTYNHSESSKNWKIVQWIIMHVWEVLLENTAKIGGFFGNLKGKISANFQNRNFLDFSSLCNHDQQALRCIVTGSTTRVLILTLT